MGKEMRNFKTVLVIPVAMLMVLVAQAEMLVVPAGTVADCIPSPSIEAIKSASVFQGENPALIQMITCDVIKGQPIPAKFRLLGELRAVSVLGPYSLVWQQMQLRGDQGDLVWNPKDEDLVSSRIQSDGTLRMTFKHDLNIDPATAPN